MSATALLGFRPPLAQRRAFSASVLHGRQPDKSLVRAGGVAAVAAPPPSPAPPRAPLRRGLLGKPWDHIITIAVCIYFAYREDDVVEFTLYALGAMGVFASIWDDD
ncbi:hypothetical protein C2E20_0168 [Micractinium conductrix]|uniref:Uncharacterized protein n=1 Tax=Micractinium conductrix TaxID=554055 RepID=A0A2P6VR76_9CHLO|nr:hypothetical protein C2E20_0168 [Micractinium conductrix]|eukprot:PSC76606.1 hypothetical protein C2E20_0168 [Micractinium conductrix]